MTGRSRFVNDQTFSYTSSSYVQRAAQKTHFDTISATQNGGHGTAVEASYDFPLTVAYPILPTSTGYKLPIKVYQSYDAGTSDSGPHGDSTQTFNTVVSKGTMIFDKSFNWTGVRNDASLQLYTYQSKHPSICYGKQIKSKDNVVTSISRPGCSAPPPR